MKQPQREKASSRSEDLNRFNKSWTELDFWIQSIGSPLLVVEKHSLTVICGNRGSERFFAVAQNEFPGLQIAQLVGAEANQMLGQIWSNAPVGVPGEPLCSAPSCSGRNGFSWSR